MASLVVEQKILGELSDSVLTQNIIRSTEDEVIDDIAGEKPQDAEKRKEIQHRLKIKQEVLTTVREYQKQRNPIMDPE